MLYTILNNVQRICNSGEARVLRMLRGGRMPTWVISAQAAPAHLRQFGVDIVVTTGRKDVFLQVKRNYAWANLTKRLTEFPLAIVVCSSDTSDEHLHMRLIEGLEYGYNRT